VNPHADAVMQVSGLRFPERIFDAHAGDGGAVLHVFAE
jgi:hypothetical protein